MYPFTTHQKQSATYKKTATSNHLQTIPKPLILPLYITPPKKTTQKNPKTPPPSEQLRLEELASDLLQRHRDHHLGGARPGERPGERLGGSGRWWKAVGLVGLVCMVGWFLFSFDWFLFGFDWFLFGFDWFLFGFDWFLFGWLVCLFGE